MRALPLPASLMPCALVLAACASGNANQRPAAVGPLAPMPGWVQNEPVVNGRVYAVGRSGRTYWAKDALTNAAEDARGKLALGLQSKMEVLTKRAESDTGSTHLDLVKAATDMMVQNTVIEATWVDNGGVQGEPGAVFALAYIELDKAHGSAKQQEVVTAGEKGVPDWINRLPGQAGRMYARGYSGPTRVIEDAAAYSGDDAVENLAKALRSHVQAYQLLVENNLGVSLDEFSRTENPDDAFLAMVKKQAKVETTWVDGKGSKAGYPAGSVWALAYIEVGSTKGGYEQIANEATGPALSRTGDAGAEPQAKPVAAPAPAPAAAHAEAGKAADHGGTVPASTVAPGPADPKQLGAILARPASTVAPAAPPARDHLDGKGKLAPYPSEGERCKAGYENTGGWCLPLSSRD